MKCFCCSPETLKIELEIKEFAAFFIVEYSKLNVVHNYVVLSLEDFKKKPYKEFFDSINSLLIFYEEIVDEMNIDKLEKKGTLMSKNEFMIYMVSRCLKLSGDNPTFFEFLLVCLYLGKIAELLYAKYKCCKLLKIIADCLETVYCRKYWTFFEVNDGFSGLADFCKKLNKSSKSKCGRSFRFFETEASKRVENLRDLDNVHKVFVLNLMEMRLLKMKPYPVPYGEKVDFLIQMDALDEECQEDWNTNTEFSCPYCKANCYQYTSYLATVYPRLSGGNDRVLVYNASGY